MEHQWHGCKCERCGADREKVEITRVSTLRELGLRSKDGFQIKSYAKELNNIASGDGPASYQANLALKDIVLNNQNLGVYLLSIVGYITDPSIYEDPVILHKISEVDSIFCPNTADHKQKWEKVAGSDVKIDSETRQIMYHMERCTQCGKKVKFTDYDYDTDGYL